MTQEVRDESGIIHEFPDEATPEQMMIAIKGHQSNVAPQESESNKIKSITGDTRTPFDTLRDLVSGAISGLGKGGQTIASIATGGYAPKVNFDEMLEGVSSPNKSIGGNITKGIGEYLPYGIAGGTSTLGLLGAGAAHGAATAEPEEQNLFGILPKGKLGGAIESALLNMIIPGGLKLAEKLRPSKMFRGNLSPQELQRNIDITKGTETGLGDVIESPFLKKRLENTLTSVPFSGANESLQRTGELVKQKGENILNKMLGNNSPENVPAQLTDELINQFKSHQANKNALYKNANELATTENLKLELPNFAKKANEVSDAIEATNILKYEPDISKIFNKLKNYKNPIKEEAGAIVDVNGNPLSKTITTPTLEEANILKGKLNEYSKTMGKSSNASERNLSRVFGQLGKSLKNDINETIDKSGSNELKKAYQSAEKNYAENFSPFLDKEIYKYISGSADPETIVQKFLKTSPNVDLAGQLAKLSKKMPIPKRQLLMYSYLSRALDNEGNLNPSKLGTAIQKLGPNQLKELVPDPSLRKELLDYNKLQKMNKEAQYLMFNPKTGQRNSDTLMTGLLALLGNIGAGKLGATLATSLPIAGGHIMTKALTSSSLRESLVKEMMRSRTRFNTTNKRTIGSTLIQSLAKQLEGTK